MNRNRLGIFWIFLFLSLGTTLAFGQNKVVYMMPEPHLIQEIPRGQFDVHYILTKEDYLENKKQFKGVPLKKLCFVEQSNNLEEMRNCLKNFQQNLKNGEVFKYLVNGASEDEVMIGGILRSEFAIKRGMKKAEAEIFVDKYKMKQKLQKNNPGIPTARFLTLKGKEAKKQQNRIQNLNIPLIFKPTDKAGSEGVIIIKTQQELVNAIQTVMKINPEGEYIVEEFIDGPVMRIDGFIINGEVQVAYPSYYNPSCFLYYRQGLPQVTHSDFSATRKKEYNEFTQDVISALGLQNGAYHLEAIRSNENGKLYFLEIGARPGGDSEFLEEFYHYPYEQIHVRSQVDLPTPTQLIPHTGKNGFAIVDCPTLPPAVGKQQKLLNFSYNEQFNYTGLCDDKTILPQKGEVFQVDDMIGTLAQFYFKGPEKTVFNQGKRLRDSAKATFQILDQMPYDKNESGYHSENDESELNPPPSKRSKNVEWPLSQLPQ